MTVYELIQEKNQLKQENQDLKNAIESLKEMKEYYYRLYIESDDMLMESIGLPTRKEMKARKQKKSLLKIVH